MKKTFSRILCIAAMAVTVFACSPSDGNTPKDSTMPKITRNFDDLTNWFAEGIKRTHPYVSSAWSSDVDIADFNLLLVNQEKNRVVKITPNGKKEIPEKDWSDDLVSELHSITSFGYTTINDVNHTLIVCDFAFFDEKAEMTKEALGYVFSDEAIVYDWLALFYHESFHHFVQRPDKDWISSGQASDRSQNYPIDYQPRICRKLALIALKQAWQQESVKDAQYARAKYWMAKYEKNYAQESALIKDYDIDEASAEYFSRFIMHSAFPSFDALYDIDKNNIATGVDAESYMQCVALQLLRRDGRLNEAVEACKSHSMTPIHCLLKNTELPTDYDENQDAEDIRRLTDAMDKAFGNNPLLQPISELVTRHKAGQQLYLALKTKNGAYVDLMGEYTLTDLPGLRCIINLSSSVEMYDIESLTILGQSDYYLVPLAGETALSLSDVQSSDDLSPLNSVTIQQHAQLTAAQVEGVSIKELPAETFIGNDSFGNKYYICKFTN